MEAKQIVFMVVGVALCASVVFMIGLQAGSRMEDGSASAGEVVNQALQGGAGLQTAGAARFSFFEELRTPATVDAIRKLDSPEGNANNTPELAKKAQKRRDFEARQKAWQEKQGSGEVAVKRRAEPSRSAKRGATDGAAPEQDEAGKRTLERGPEVGGGSAASGGLSLREGGVVPSRL